MIPESENTITIPRKEWEDSQSSIKTLWKVAKLFLATICLNFLCVVAVLMFVNDSNDRLKTGRESRVGYQADLMFVECELSKDERSTLPEGDAARLNQLCSAYSSPEQAEQTEETR